VSGPAPTRPAPAEAQRRPATPQAGGSPAWWVRLAALAPFWLLYGAAAVAAWIAPRLLRRNPAVVREHLAIAFPELEPHAREAIVRDFYRGFAQIAVEVLKAARLSPRAIVSRVRVSGVEGPRAELSAGTPVLLVAAHQCNWEWMLLALALELGFPIDAAYKPLVDRWADREMLRLRSRFGSRLVPAQDLLGDILRRGKLPRAIAMVADQEPRTSEHKHWTRFLNRDTAFYVGAEEIARVTRFAVFFVGMRRTARGRYVVSIEPLAGRGETLAPTELTERYVRRVEAQIRAAPADWPWSHKRWKLRKSLYSGA